jgi:hypothetical protein
MKISASLAAIAVLFFSFTFVGFAAPPAPDESTLMADTCLDAVASQKVPIGQDEITGAYQDAVDAQNTDHAAVVGSDKGLTRTLSFTNQQSPQLFSVLKRAGLKSELSVVTLTVSQWPDRALASLSSGGMLLASQEYRVSNNKLQIFSGMVNKGGTFGCASYETVGRILEFAIIATDILAQRKSPEKVAKQQ